MSDNHEDTKPELSVLDGPVHDAHIGPTDAQRLSGLQVNCAKVDYFVNRSLMLVTALSPIIGYDKCAKLAHYAHEHDLSLREANEALKFISDEQFLKVVRPEAMTKPDVVPA